MKSKNKEVGSSESEIILEVAKRAPETREQKEIRQRKPMPQPPAGEPLWKIEPQPILLSEPRKPETEVE